MLGIAEEPPSGDVSLVTNDRIFGQEARYENRGNRISIKHAGWRGDLARRNSGMCNRAHSTQFDLKHLKCADEIITLAAKGNKLRPAGDKATGFPG